jgi:hypothetical protein
VTSLTKESETMTTSETTITTTTTTSMLEFATISSSFVPHGTLLHVSMLEAAQAVFANITAQFRLRNAVMSSKQDPHVILLEGLADVTPFLAVVEAFMDAPSAEMCEHNVCSVTFAAPPRRVEHLQVDIELYPFD